MKKIFTLIVAGVAMLGSFTASAGIQPSSVGHTLRQRVTHPAMSHTASSSRALTCDTLVNLNFNTADSNANIFGFAAPNVGFISGTGALFGGGTTYFPITQVGEQFTASARGGYVTSATVYLEALTLNAATADSNLTITAYVYDTTGTGAFGGYGLSATPLDSATVNLSRIIANGGARFTFTNQAVLSGDKFFVMVGIPQITGDSIALLTNDGTTGNGHIWYNTGVGSVSLDSLSGGGTELGTFMFATVCGLNNVTCPTITVAATQIGHTTTAYATPTGGVAPYTYLWSNAIGQVSDTATGLTYGATYTVTATDHNGCTGVGRVTIGPNGITDIAGMTEFSVYPNPSNGVFTTSVKLESSSDVTISVVDMTGNKVYESTDKSAKDITKQINLNSIAAGIYIVNVKTATGTINQRISVK